MVVGLILQNPCEMAGTALAESVNLQLSSNYSDSVSSTAAGEITGHNKIWKIISQDSGWWEQCCPLHDIAMQSPRIHCTWHGQVGHGKGVLPNIRWMYSRHIQIPNTWHDECINIVCWGFRWHDATGNRPQISPFIHRAHLYLPTTQKYSIGLLLVETISIGKDEVTRFL